MPAISLNTYLNEDDFKIYMENKENYNTVARDALKAEIEKTKRFKRK